MTLIGGFIISEHFTFEEANVTGADDPLDIAELVYLVDYMF